MNPMNIKVGIQHIVLKSNQYKDLKIWQLHHWTIQTIQYTLKSILIIALSIEIKIAMDILVNCLRN
jgi:hypothetical protein